MDIKQIQQQAIEYFKQNIEKFKNAYNENSFVKKMRDFSVKAGAKIVYTVYKLFYALKSDAVPLKDKIIAMAALGYFISPIDLIPDIFSSIGLIDDAAILAWALGRIDQYITPDIDEKAREKVFKLFGPVKFD